MIVRALESFGGEAAISQIREATSESVVRIRRALRDLEAEGKVRRVGERGSTRYQIGG